MTHIFPPHLLRATRVIGRRWASTPCGVQSPPHTSVLQCRSSALHLNYGGAVMGSNPSPVWKPCCCSWCVKRRHELSRLLHVVCVKVSKALFLRKKPLTDQTHQDKERCDELEVQYKPTAEASGGSGAGGAWVEQNGMVEWVFHPQGSKRLLGVVAVPRTLRASVPWGLTGRLKADMALKCCV